MVVLKRVGVLKAACFLGIFGAFMGLIFGFILVITASMLSGLISGLGGTVNTQVTWISLILFPLVSGVLSFLASFIFVPLTNLSLRIVRGIDLDIVE